MDNVGAGRVAAVVTDDAANMRAARQLLAERTGYGHIITMRCWMHGFALVMRSVVGHPYAKDAIVTAQRLVTFFRASHKPLAELKAAARRLGITGGGLVSSNTTRFMSLLDCIESVLRNAAAFKHIAADDTIAQLLIIKRPGQPNIDLVPIIQNPGMWQKLELVCHVLAPFRPIIMAMQHREARLADVVRAFVYLARHLQLAAANIPPGTLLHARVVRVGPATRQAPTPHPQSTHPGERGEGDAFPNHVAVAYNDRAKTMLRSSEGVVCSLALLLHPSYRDAVVQDIREMKKAVSLA